MSCLVSCTRPVPGSTRTTQSERNPTLLDDGLMALVGRD